MNTNEAIEKIGSFFEDLIANNEEIFTWDQEILIKKDLVKDCSLQEIFNDEVYLENMYWYEMFNEKYNIPNEKKIKMVATLIDLFDLHAGIDLMDVVDIDSLT